MTKDKTLLKEFLTGPGICCKCFQVPGIRFGAIQEELKYRKENSNISDYHKTSTEELKFMVDSFIPRDEIGNEGWHYCNKLDKETGKCKVYETRPYMCRNFPIAELGGRCSINTCTSEYCDAYKDRLNKEEFEEYLKEGN